MCLCLCIQCVYICSCSSVCVCSVHVCIPTHVYVCVCFCFVFSLVCGWKLCEDSSYTCLHTKQSCQSHKHKPPYFGNASRLVYCRWQTSSLIRTRGGGGVMDTAYGRVRRTGTTETPPPPPPRALNIPAVNHSGHTLMLSIQTFCLSLKLNDLSYSKKQRLKT